MKLRPAFLFVLILGSTFAYAQFGGGSNPAWTGIISPGRAIDWHAIAPGVAGGIPTRTTICATILPSTSDESVTINSAIAACPAGEVVYLAAGTHTLAAGIVFAGKSSVTLRGAGPLRTILRFTTSGYNCLGNKANVCVLNPSPSYYYGSSAVTPPSGSNQTTWVAGYAQGTTQITLGNASKISPGMTLILDQVNDGADTGGYVVCDVLDTCHNAGNTGSYAGRTVNSVHANQTQIVTVTAKSGNEVTISPGLYAPNWRAAQNPGAWWMNSMITGVGIEDLTLDNHLDVASIQSGIVFWSATQSWVKDIRSILGNRNHIWILQSAHVTVRDSYFFGTENGGYESYGVEDAVASDLLVENNIFHYITAPTIGAGGEGSVFGYNYTNTNYNTAPETVLAPVWASHDAANNFKLFEGNNFNALECDATHGTSNEDTYFRNWLTGWEPGKDDGTNAVMLVSMCRGFNIVGNVLGTSGYHSTYQTTPGSKVDCALSIYSLGWSSAFCANSQPTPDPLVASSLLRWGNYDVVNMSVRWNSSEVPAASLPNLANNAVPANHTLPVSFYLTAQPPFWSTPWGTPPWPATGPDVTGGNGPGGFAYANPAQICFDHTPIDTNFLAVGTGQALAFEANNCY